MVFSNRITGQSLGECELTAEESKALEKWSEVLGGQFELTIEAGFTMTIRRPGQPDSLFTLVPNPLQVASFDLDMVLLTRLTEVSYLGSICLLYHMFYMAWKKERFDSLALLTMLGPPSQQNEILDSRLQSVSNELIRTNVKNLTAFRDYALRPLDIMGLLGTPANILPAALPKVTKTVEEWNQVLESGRPLTARVVRTVLSIELSDFIPLATSWWAKLRVLLLRSSVIFADWFEQEATVKMKHMQIFPACTLWDAEPNTYWAIQDLQQIALRVCMRCKKPSSSEKGLSLVHFKDSGHMDPISRFKPLDRPHLHLCSEHPIAAIEEHDRVLFRAAPIHLNFRAPNMFYTRLGSDYPYNYRVPFSNQSLLTICGVTTQNQYAWDALALRGYLHLQSNQTPPRESVRSKFDCVHGKIDLKSEGVLETEGDLRLTQQTASRTHLYFLMAHRAILRVPIRPNNPPYEIYLLESPRLDPKIPNRVRPYRELEGLHSTDPRFSHVFAYFGSVRQVLLADMRLECPAELYPNQDSAANIVCLPGDKGYTTWTSGGSE